MPVAYFFYFIYFFFLRASNFLAPIILHLEIVKLNVTKSYILLDLMEGVGVLALV